MNKGWFIKAHLKIGGAVGCAGACVPKRAFAYLAAPVGGLNCLDNVLRFFVLVKSYREKNITGLKLS